MQYSYLLIVASKGDHNVVTFHAESKKEAVKAYEGFFCVSLPEMVDEYGLIVEFRRISARPSTLNLPITGNVTSRKCIDKIKR